MDLSSFERAYNDARYYFNSKFKAPQSKKVTGPKAQKRLREENPFNTSIDIMPVDTTNLHMISFATVALMLVHNLKRGHPLNIDTIETYDLNTFQEFIMFDPYVDYIVYKRDKNQDRIHNKNYYATYNAMMVRLLWEAQKRGIKAFPQ